MSKLYTVWNYLCRYKYVVILLFAALIIGVVDENSLLSRSKRWKRINELEKEVADYEHRYETATKELEKLNNDPSRLEKLAREMYYMKRDNEDVYVIRTTDQDEDEGTDALTHDSIAQ